MQLADSPMIRILVVHGAGLERRGLENVATFGALTMADYNAAIAGFATDLNLEISIFHSLDADAIILNLVACKANGVDGVIINPANFTVGQPSLAQAIMDTGLPTVELHISNPANRGVVSDIAPSTTGVVAGFGVRGYLLALQGLRDLIVTSRSS